MQFRKNNRSDGPFFVMDSPDICPHCHVANQPGHQFHYFDNNSDKLYSIWTCHSKICGKVFITEHIEIAEGIYYVNRFLNGLPKGPNWPKPILELKDGRTINLENVEESKFIKTYLQSLEAESMGFDEIAGMGFRKAIEYLVKDWAIHNKPNEKDKILSLWMSQIISEYFIGDVKEILDRATWLGNDQSHYNKLFEDFNISHLKELIDLIMVELDREFKKKQYIENIEKRK